MRRVVLSLLLLAGGASCTTVQPGQQQVAGSVRSASHFHVHVAAAPVSSPPRSTASKAVESADRVELATAQAEQDSEPSIILANWQQAPLPPAPEPAPIAGFDVRDMEAARDENAAGSSQPIRTDLTLDQAIGMALAGNPTILEASASVHRLQAERAQSGFYPNPTAGYVASEIGNDGRAGQQGVYFGQTFVTADKLDHNRAIAAGGVAFAVAQVEAQRLRVTTDTTIRFYEALGAQRLVEIEKRIAENARLSRDATQDRFDVGEANRVDLLQAETIFQRATVSVRQAEARAEGAWRRLAAMLGHPDLPPASLAGALEPDRLPDDFEAVWQRVRTMSPELQAASAQVARTRARIGREQAQAVPDVDAQNSLQYDTSTNYTVVGLQWTVPVPIIHKNQGAIAGAQSAHVRACRDYQRIELDLRSRLAAAFRDINVARVQVTTYRDEVIPAAEESLDLIREGYKQGEFNVLRLITSQQIYADSLSEYLEALIDLQTAQATVDGLLLTGGLEEPTAPDPVGGLGGLSEVPKAE